ncbi:sporulation histidine kinase inhibitor Sda [Metabacillus litoralis]
MLVRKDNKIIIDAYYQAIKLNLEPNFIHILEYELLRRGLINQIKKTV